MKQVDKNVTRLLDQSGHLHSHRVLIETVRAFKQRSEGSARLIIYTMHNREARKVSRLRTLQKMPIDLTRGLKSNLPYQLTYF